MTHLSIREQQVLASIARGRVNKEIARELGIALKTVKTHARHIFKKLGARNRTEAAVMTLQGRR